MINPNYRANFKQNILQVAIRLGLITLISACAKSQALPLLSQYSGPELDTAATDWFYDIHTGKPVTVLNEMLFCPGMKAGMEITDPLVATGPDSGKQIVGMLYPSDKGSATYNVRTLYADNPGFPVGGNIGKCVVEKTVPNPNLPVGKQMNVVVLPGTNEGYELPSYKYLYVGALSENPAYPQNPVPTPVPELPNTG